VNLFVRNLAWRVTDEELRAYFEPYGTVTSARVVLDRDTGRSRGFGFVEMTDSSEAERAIRSLNGATLDGRVIAVDEARERPPR
jgi:RNA recognition motif-containing protein